MLTCRDFISLTSNLVDRELPRTQMFGVGFHWVICPYCRRFLKHLRHLRGALLLRDDDLRGARAHTGRTAKNPVPSPEKPADATPYDAFAERLVALAIRRQAGSNNPPPDG